MDTEPALTAGAIVGVLTAALTLAVAFGAPITKDQQTAIIAFATLVFPIIGAVWVRAHVTPVASIGKS